jgi:hypothetical protein
VFDVGECEECGKHIGPDVAYVAIDIAGDSSPDEPGRAVHLHLGDCLARFRLKQPASAREATPQRKR